MGKWYGYTRFLGNIQMKLKDFIEKKQVRKASEDIPLAKSLLRTAEIDLEFLKKLKIDDISARKIMTNYYDVLRSILEAIAILKGYKIYSHEAFTYFLKEEGEDLIAKKFDRLRRIRNGINYYGKSISIEEVGEIISQISKLIKILREKYLNKIL